MPPTSTPFGQRVARRLRDESVIWLTTVSADGTPQPNPVWFLWDGTSLLIYSLATAARLAHIARNARVSLHFNSDDQGDDIIVITGEAHVAPGEPSAEQMPEYLRKYSGAIAREFGTPASFAAQYSVPLRITPVKVRGY
jgi:PPOX class probable F420-dependent enzyme